MVGVLDGLSLSGSAPKFIWFAFGSPDKFLRLARLISEPSPINLTHPIHQPSILFILPRTVNDRENLDENIDIKIAPLIWSTDTVPLKRLVM